MRRPAGFHAVYQFLVEQWFLTFAADVEFRIVMTPDDLKQAGLDDLGKKWA